MSQWTNLLRNLGIWDGSFTHLSAQGELIDDVPSRVSLVGIDGDRTVCQTVQMLSPDRHTITSERVLTYSSLSRSVLVFETGAFSQGSMQYGPFSDFGAELGFIDGDRRLRLVQLFDKNAQLSNLTLIREHRQGTDSSEIKHLETDSMTVSHLLGTWRGTATTLFADLSPSQTSETLRTVQLDNSDLIENMSLFGTATVTRWHCKSYDQLPTRLKTNDPQQPLQCLLLPGGGLSITPLSIPRQQSFSLVAGWFISPTQRQQMIRQYDPAGAWVSLTLIVEHAIHP